MYKISNLCIFAVLILLHLKFCIVNVIDERTIEVNESKGNLFQFVSFIISCFILYIVELSHSVIHRFR